jgi:hypothetical protein
MKSREDGSMITAFTSIYSKLGSIGYKPTLHILDNECSRAVHKFLTSKETARQNVKAHHQNSNAAEPAVKSAKYHIISHVATLDNDCPIQLWSEMLPQMEDTLNMMRTSRNNNDKTAYEEIHGAFDWNKTPLAPLGNKGMVYLTPNTRNTFAPHCDEAFTVRRAPFHHQLLIFSYQRPRDTKSLEPTASTQPTGRSPPCQSTRRQCVPPRTS